MTLDKRGSGLRGCIGIFDRSEPLYKNIISRAVAAAVYDTRFKKVAPDELKEIKLEISVLTKPTPMPYDSPQDLLNKLKPHVHVIIIRTRWGSSTYLPQVWEQLPEKESFLSHLCQKHGAPANTWENGPSELKVSTYEAIVFGEKEYGRQVVGRKGAIVGKNGATIIGFSPTVPQESRTDQLNAPKGTRLMPGTVLSPNSDISSL